MEALLTKMLDTIGAGDSDGGTDAPLPELSDTVRLPPPSEAMKETRRKLAEIEKEALAMGDLYGLLGLGVECTEN